MWLVVTIFPLFTTPHSSQNKTDYAGGGHTGQQQHRRRVGLRDADCGGDGGGRRRRRGGSQETFRELRRRRRIDDIFTTTDGRHELNSGDDSVSSPEMERVLIFDFIALNGETNVWRFIFSD